MFDFISGAHKHSKLNGDRHLQNTMPMENPKNNSHPQEGGLSLKTRQDKKSNVLEIQLNVCFIMSAKCEDHKLNSVGITLRN